MTFTPTSFKEFKYTITYGPPLFEPILNVSRKTIKNLDSKHHLLFQETSFPHKKVISSPTFSVEWVKVNSSDAKLESSSVNHR